MTIRCLLPATNPDPHRLAERLVSMLRARSLQLKTAATFYPFPKLARESRGRGTIHDVVIETQGHAQVLPYLNLAVNYAGFLRDPPRVTVSGKLARGIPQPLPLPNMPTAVTKTELLYSPASWGFLVTNQ